MKTETKIAGNIITIRHELSDLELRILQHVNEVGYIEFRTSHIESNPLDSSKQFGRNDCIDLVAYSLLQHNDDSWHMEFNLSDLGKKILEQ